jgi:hypothetical protein
LFNRDGLRKVTMDGGAMAVLSLFEAAEQAATSKVDVWRAIQDGALPAQKTSDGGYAIEPADLFRVFERKQPEPRLTPPGLTPAPEEAAVVKTQEASEEAAADDVSAAFAALQAELKNLLGSPGKAVLVGEEKRRDEPEERSDDLAEQNGCLAADIAVEKAKAGRVVDGSAAPEDKLTTPTQTGRPWWRRLSAR